MGLNLGYVDVRSKIANIYTWCLYTTLENIHNVFHEYYIEFWYMYKYVLLEHYLVIMLLYDNFKSNTRG